MLRQARTDTPLLMIRGAKTGRWTITTDAGSVGLTAVATAHELPRPRIDAHLARDGARRILHYSIASQPGMQVSFEEVGKNGGQMLGAARGSHGTISFLPSGASGRRSIVAVVTQNGAPRANIQVASFSSPPPKPGRLRDIHVTRSHGGLLVSFHPAPLSTATIVAVRFSEGRSAILEARGRGRSVVVPDAPVTSKPKSIVVRGLRGAVKGPAVRIR